MDAGGRPSAVEGRTAVIEAIQATEESRLDRLRAANRQRLAQHLNRHRVTLLSSCRRTLGNFDWAEDAVQEASARAMTTASQYDPARARDGMGFEAWFHRVLMNVCTDMQRAKTRRPSVEFSALPESIIESVTRAADDVEVMALRGDGWDLAGIEHVELEGYAVGDMMDAFARLHPHDRWILEQVLLEDVEEIELARKHGFTANAIRSRLMTARQNLKTQLLAVQVARNASK